MVRTYHFESAHTCMWVDSIIKREGVVPNGVQFYKTIPACDKPLDVLLAGLRELT